MKQFIIITFLSMCSISVAAAEQKNKEWQPTTLKEETIQQIQKAQHHYKECIAKEMQKQDYAKIDSRNATDIIIKSCESDLSKIRQVYLDVDVPEVVADRHLQKMRVQMTRRLLKEMIVLEASRAGQSK